MYMIFLVRILALQMLESGGKDEDLTVAAPAAQ